MENLQPLIYPLGIILYIWLFWAAYVLVMGFYRAKLNNKLNNITIILGFPFVLVGILMDIVANLIIAPFVFLDMPRELLVTTRLQRYIKDDNGWRKNLSTAICDNLLDIFDPSGNHC